MHDLLFQLDALLLLVFLGTGFSEAVSVREFHHGYLGDALVLISFVFGGTLLALVGVTLRADDTYEHVKQAWLGEPLFESPLHKLYGKYLWPIKIVQKLNAWLDKKFGKK